LPGPHLVLQIMSIIQSSKPRRQGRGRREAVQRSLEFRLRTSAPPLHSPAVPSLIRQSLIFRSYIISNLSSETRAEQERRATTCSLQKTMSEFNIYVPENLSFPDYIAIVQTARVLADGYDKKVSTSLARYIWVLLKFSDSCRITHAC
jgi:hypothetical protein